MILTGKVVKGSGEQRRRMKKFPEVFRVVLGKNFYPGTINVRVETPIKIKTAFRIPGELIEEPLMDLLFEKCEIKGLPAYRMRVFNRRSGYGSWGDEVLEIVGEYLPVCQNEKIKIKLFRSRLRFWYESRTQKVVRWRDSFGRNYAWVVEK